MPPAGSPEQADVEDMLAYARQRKKQANQKHHQRKKAAAVQTGLAVQLVGADLEAARTEHAALSLQHTVLSAVTAYQEDALQALQLAGLAAAVDPDAGPETAPPTRDGPPTFKEGLYAVEELSGLPGGAAAAGAQLAQQLACAQLAASAEADPPSAVPASLQELGASSSSGSGSHSSGSAPTDQTASSGRTAEHAVPEGAASASGTVGQGRPAGAAGAAAGAPSARPPVPPAQAEQRLPAGAAGAAAGGSRGDDSRLVQSAFEQAPVHRFWNVEKGLPAWVRAVAVAGMRLLPKSVVVARHAAFMERLQHTVAEWKARPAARPQLEAVLTERLSDRQYLTRTFAHYRPADLLEFWGKHMCPAPPAPAPEEGGAGVGTGGAGRPPLHELLVPIAHYLEGILSTEQRAQLRQVWVRYLHRTQALRRKRASAAAGIQISAALHAHAWQAPAASSADKAQHYADACEGAGCLATLAEAEIFALLDLQGDMLTLLRPVDAARVVLAAHPYTTDLTQLCAWLFPETVAPPPPPPSTLPLQQQQQQPSLLAAAELLGVGPAGLAAAAAEAALSCEDPLLSTLLQEEALAVDDLGLLLGDLPDGSPSAWAAAATAAGTGADAGHFLPPGGGDGHGSGGGA